MRKTEKIIFVIILICNIILIFNVDRILTNIDPKESHICKIVNVYKDSNLTRVGYIPIYHYVLEDNNITFDKTISELSYNHAIKYKYKESHRNIKIDLYKSDIDKSILTKVLYIRIFAAVIFILSVLIFIIRLYVTTPLKRE